MVWVTPQRWWSDAALDWLDAVGLAAYAVFGAAKALGYGIPPVPAAVMGVVTACVGGIIRDVMAGEPSILMRPELYVTAAALASSLYVALSSPACPLRRRLIAARRRLRAAGRRDRLETRPAHLSRRALRMASDGAWIAAQRFRAPGAMSCPFLRLM